MPRGKTRTIACCDGALLVLATTLRFTARGLAVLGVVAFLAAAVRPGSLSAYVSLGFALWVLALLARITRTYILREPMPGRDGPFEYKEQPGAYHMRFIVAVLLFGFVLGILIRSFMATL
jgi:hypothetical protein